jgi:hypothetical protein
MYKLYNVHTYMLLGMKSLRNEKQRMSYFTYYVPSHEIIFLNFGVSEMHVRLVTKKQCSFILYV